jgi:hypothetical protein
MNGLEAANVVEAAPRTSEAARAPKIFFVCIDEFLL